jgi:hypothetical protein
LGFGFGVGVCLGWVLGSSYEIAIWTSNELIDLDCFIWIGLLDQVNHTWLHLLQHLQKHSRLGSFPLLFKFGLSSLDLCPGFKKNILGI